MGVSGLKVSLFITCLADVFYPNVGKDVVEVLERQGCTVDFPASQTCCGQPAFNSGYHKETKEVAKKMIRAFEHSEYVVAPSGSCAAMLHEYPHLFKDDSGVWLKRAEELAAKTYEFTQFLVDVLGVEGVGAACEAKATFHSSCHMTRLLGVKNAPMKLLKQVEGLDYTELPGRETCCGFGGTFSVKMKPISEQMVDEKIAHIEETGSNVLIGADCGCLMNISGRLERLGKPVQVKHIAEILNQQKV